VKTLKLTSPYMRGAAVRRMQMAMDRHHWLKGEVDGAYGPVSAQGAYRSKYWLGYAQPDQAAGDVLLAYLEGRRVVTPKMEEEARLRKFEAAEVPLRQKALDYMLRQLGTKEKPPGSNRIDWASDWYGLMGAA